MTTQDFYIRETGENEARGPMNLEQLTSLAENTLISAETLWFDPAAEAWAPLGSNAELKALLFPEKRKLRLMPNRTLAPRRTRLPPPAHSTHPASHMATQEFYIREASENEARGPFNLEQLISLAETGQVTLDTLWYDPGIEDWALISTNDELKAHALPGEAEAADEGEGDRPPPKGVRLGGADHGRGHARRRRGADVRHQGQGRPGHHAGPCRPYRDVVGGRLPRPLRGGRDPARGGCHRRDGHRRSS